MRAFLIPAGIVLAALSAPAAAQDISPDEAAKIDTIVESSLKNTGVPSASIAIVRGGKLVFAKAWGKQAKGWGKPRVDAPYQIASVSKQFTAAALLLLEDDGKLSLDDTVGKYLPDISGGDRITLRQLLSHTSGLQDFWPQDYSFAAMARPTTPQNIIDRWAKKPLDFEPGTQWQYSNTGYVVAGVIIEKVAGMSLLDLLQARIFGPLGMKVMDQDKAIGPKYPQGYRRYALGPVRLEQPAAAGWLYAAGELAMSPSDLAKWDIARMNRSLLPAEDWAAQETPVILRDGTNTGYGLGVTIGKIEGRRYIEHSGEAVGFLSENIVFPEDKAAVVVLTNGWFSNAYRTIARQITQVVLPAPVTTADDSVATGEARAVFDALRTGTLDRALLTDNANYYFTETALGDYRASLGGLGDATSFTLVAPPRARGGFINRDYRVRYAGRTLRIVTYREPGGARRFEQFLVMPEE